MTWGVSGSANRIPQLIPWQVLVHRTNEELAPLDVGFINLCFTMGLLGSEKIDVELCLRRLYEMYAYARDHISDKPFFRLRRRYKNCWPLYRIHALVAILQKKFGVYYDLKQRCNPVTHQYDNPLEFDHYFIHGILQGPGGVCATIPVVYVSVGRRLGHPLKLVHALSKPELESGGHCFFRWDDPRGDRFNVDVMNSGFRCPTDMSFRTGWYTTDMEAEQTKAVLKSCTPRQEMASFLHQRAAYQQNTGYFRGAAESRMWSYALDPNVVTESRLVNVINDWSAVLRQRRPPGFPNFEIVPSPRLFLDSVPEQYELAYHAKSVIQFITNDPEWEAKWWAPMRRGARLPKRLTKIRMKWNASGGYEVAPVCTPETETCFSN